MATATAQDDDLLIIADDSTTDDSDDNIEFSFDFGEDTPTKEEAKIEEIAKIEEVPQEISLREEASSTTSEMVIEDSKMETEGELDLGINFDTIDTESAIQVATEEKGETSTEKPEEVSIAPVSSEDSMNNILSATIAKLVTRQESIAFDKAEKSKKEEELKTQIKDLQDQVSELESDMKLLDIETDKISSNTQELENMKLDPVKEHNVKRVKK